MHGSFAPQSLMLSFLKNWIDAPVCAANLMSTLGVVTICGSMQEGPGETSDVTATSSLPVRVSDAMLTSYPPVGLVPAE